MHCKSLWIKASAKSINVNVKCKCTPEIEQDISLLSGICCQSNAASSVDRTTD